MFVSHDLKLIYIAVPGTGCTSFHTSLICKSNNWEHPWPKSNHPVWSMTNIFHGLHFTAWQVRAALDPDIWNSYEKIAFVRHPYAWANSIFHKRGTPFGFGVSYTKEHGNTFLEFLLALEKTPYFWFTDDLDTIYRTEDLNTIVLPKFGLSPRRKNQGQYSQVRITPEEKEIIDRKFAREFTYYSDEENAAFDKEWLI